MRLPDVSVVIPTYNRAFVLYNTILSLKYQLYPPEKFEIIVVDDGSTDITESLVRKANLKNLTFIPMRRNMGDGVARNKGVSAAEGELIIFCDSDMIVRPTHIASHVNAHIGKSGLAVSGLGHWEYVLTYDYGPQWATKKGLSREYARPFIKERLAQAKDHNLITEKEIQLQKLEPFRVLPGHPLREWETMFDEITEKFGYSLAGFHCPWLSFCTGNVSVRTDVFRNLGGFDEQLLRMKDLELGYRLFLAGGNFIFSNEAEAFLQVTDSVGGRKDAAKKALRYFARKHNALEVHLMGLDLLGRLNYCELSQVISQHYLLKGTKPHLRAIITQFESMARLLAEEGIRPPLRRYLSKPFEFSSLRKQYDEVQKDPVFKMWLNYYNLLMYGVKEGSNEKPSHSSNAILQSEKLHP